MCNEQGWTVRRNQAQHRWVASEMVICLILQYTNLLFLPNFIIFSSFLPSHFVTGTYSNSFTLHSLLTHRTITIKARDDARDPRIINQHYNFENGDVGYERPATNGQHLWRIPNNPQQSNDRSHPIDPLAPPPPSQSHHFNQLKPSKPPNYRKKVLKVAWHPTLNAVAVAGLYKLYLYSATTPTNQKTAKQG